MAGQQSVPDSPVDYWSLYWLSSNQIKNDVRELIESNLLLTSHFPRIHYFKINSTCKFRVLYLANEQSVQSVSAVFAFQK